MNTNHEDMGKETGGNLVNGKKWSSQDYRAVAELTGHKPDTVYRVLNGKRHNAVIWEAANRYRQVVDEAIQRVQRNLPRSVRTRRVMLARKQRAAA